MGMFFAESGIPSKAFLVSGKIERSPQQSIICLIFSVYLAFYGAVRQGRHTFEHQHAAHSIGAIHEAGRAFQNLHRADLVGIDFYAVFVAPLLAFLTNAIVDDHNAVVAQPTDDGFRDAASRGDLRHAWLLGDGIYQIGGRQLVQFLGMKHQNGHGCLFHFHVAHGTCHRHFLQFQMPEKHIGRVRQTLSRHRQYIRQ